MLLASLPPAGGSAFAVTMTADQDAGTLFSRTALVTAASEGLGFACALHLAKAGYRVAICGRRLDVLSRARAKIEQGAGIDVFAVRADLTKPKQIDTLVEKAYRRLGRLDVLVANPGGHLPYGGLEELTEAQWYEAFELIVMSAVRLARQTVPLMRAQGGGDIVFITSSTVREPPQHLLLSNALQTGVAGLAKTLSRTLAPQNIRVNVVAPGYFDTGRVRRRIDEVVERKQVQRDSAALHVAGEVPLGRIGTADELAELVTFLASRRAAYLTGATILIDGGSSHGVF
jgi:3-oxoacyl-[acyl-carrier protein] reductase